MTVPAGEEMLEYFLDSKEPPPEARLRVKTSARLIGVAEWEGWKALGF